MTYATTQDLIDRFTQAELDQVADADNDGAADADPVDRALLDAERDRVAYGSGNAAWQMNTIITMTINPPEPGVFGRTKI